MDNLKPDVQKLDIDQLKNVPTNISNLKSKIDKLNVDKLVPVPVDLRKVIWYKMMHMMLRSKILQIK